MNSTKQAPPPLPNKPPLVFEDFKTRGGAYLGNRPEAENFHHFSMISTPETSQIVAKMVFFNKKTVFSKLGNQNFRACGALSIEYQY